MPVPPPEGPGDPQLLALLRDEIRRDGPLSFHRFQELALYHPEHGYYSRGAAIGREGADFWTAPEMDPAFGELIGVQIAEMATALGDSRQFIVREYGAGTGSLAVALLDSWRRKKSPLYGPGVYTIAEASSVLRERQQHVLAAHGEVVRWLDGESMSSHAAGQAADRPGVVLMNEVLDALPVERVKATAAGLQQICVGLEGERLVEICRPAPAKLAAEIEACLSPAGLVLTEGQEAELRPQLGNFLSRATAGIDPGYLLVIDYGLPAGALYHPSRRRGTLLAYSGHRTSEDVLARVGQQDLTAHVDLTALGRAGQDCGFPAAGCTTQMRFLLALGLGEMIEASAAMEHQGRSVVERRLGMTALIRPGGMGEMFKVWIGARNSSAEGLRGLQDPCSVDPV